MKGRAVDSERLDVEAHIVAREQPSIAIEAGILDGLGRHRRAQLLEARHGARPRPGRSLRRQHRLEHRFHRPAIGRETRLRRPCRHALQDRRIAIGKKRACPVGSIDGDVRQELREHPAQGRGRHAIAQDFGPLRHAGIELCGEAARHDFAPGHQFLRRERLWPAADRRPAPGEQRFGLRVVLKCAHFVHEVVAGGAVAAPVPRKGLALQQDLFDDEPRPGAVMLFRNCLQPRPQVATVGGRIGEAVDVIDAQPVDHALGIEAQRQGMNCLESLAPLHAQAHELVDVEEATPVDAIAGHAPRGEPVVLAGQQIGETSAPLDAAIGKGKQLVEVAKRGTALRVGADRKVARRDRLVEGTTQDRQQHLRGPLARVPVDVEPFGMTAGATVAQHVPPPGIAQVGGHVIGHDVEDQAQSVAAERRGKRQQPLLAAQFGIHATRIDHVVAVHRARPGGCDG